MNYGFNWYVVRGSFNEVSKIAFNLVVAKASMDNNINVGFLITLASGWLVMG